MVKVECDGCKAPYQIDEKRIPPTGLKMRCPKCGTNILVTRPDAPSGGDQADLPAVPAKQDLPAVAGAANERRGPPGAPPRAGPPRPPPKGPPPVPKGPPPVPSRAAKPDAVEMDVDPDSEHPGIGAAGASGSRGGFGEIDLMVNLPAPGEAPVPEAGSDLPAVRAAAHPRGAPPRAAAAPAFGEVDLPAVPDGSSGFGEINLPSAHPSSPPFAQHAPRGRGRTVNIGDIDLPSVPAHGNLPQVMQGPESRGFGEIDLPLVGEENVGLPAPYGTTGLPVPAHGTGLPMPAHGAGLPVAAYGAGLPATAHGGLPMPAHGGLPMPAMGGGLPMPVDGGGLPMAFGSLPMPIEGGGLPQPIHGGGLPQPVQGGGLPVHAGGHAGGAGYPSPMAGGSDVGEEISLGGDATAPAGPTSRANAFDDSDRAVPSQMDGAEAPIGSVGIDTAGPSRPYAAVGDEAELSAAPDAAAPGAPGAEKRRPREVEAAPRQSKVRQLGIAAAVLFMLGGGAMSLVPSIGPFGASFVSDIVNAKDYAQRLAELRKTVSAQHDEDTSSASLTALERCKVVQREMPRFAETKAYCAYVALDRGLRFGRRSEDEAYAKQLLKDGGDGAGPATALAQAAFDTLEGQAQKARPAVAALAQKAPADEDVAVLAAYVELVLKTGDKAVDAWKHALSLKKSARTEFGLARAFMAAGDAKSAAAQARAAIAASPKHAGARMLLASIVWNADAAGETEALSLLKAVTDQGKALGDAELIEAYTQIGKLHLAKSRISAAEQAFGAALKINPFALQALVGNAELFYRAGRFAEALSRFEGATKADPDSVVAKVGTAKTLIALERMKEAKDLLKKLRETYASDALVTLWLGHAEESLGNKKEAEAAYVEAIKIGENRPEVVDAYVALAHLLSGVGRTDDANAKLAEAAKKFPDSPALHRAKGEVALQMGRYEEAKTELEAALAKEEDLGARFRLGEALRKMHKYDEASAMFNRVAEVDKDFPGLALERGLLFQETGQSDKALEAYRQALQKAPNDADLKLRVGSTQVIAGHAKEAIKMLEEVRKERPNSAEANHFLGRALLVRGTNLAEAMRYLELATNIDSNRAEFFLYVGWAANELQQPTKAQTALNRAIELDHELGDAYWQRGILLQKQGATMDSLADLRTALEKRPSRYEAYATMALCYGDIQKWPEAEQAWRQAISHDESNADWHFRLGKLLASHNNVPASIPELEKAVELAEGPDQLQMTWLYEAHFLLGEALRTNPAARAKAIEHLKKFQELAPRDSPYLVEVQKMLAGLGVHQ